MTRAAGLSRVRLHDEFPASILATYVAAAILYVDDETDLFELIKSRYRKEIRAGTRVCEFARSGVDALEMIERREAPYELIIADISMPHMSGLQLLSALSEREVDTPVIIVSAHDEMSNIREAMNRGAFDFLTKPVDLHDLEVTQQKALRHCETLRRAHAVERAYERPELAALGLVLAGVVHDLRNPLSSVSSFTSLARELSAELEQELSGEAREELANIRQMLERVAAHNALALELVGTLLDSAAGEQGGVELNPFVSHHVGLFLASVRSGPARIALTLDEQLDPAVGAAAIPPTKLTSVLINLLENAVHALQERLTREPDFSPALRVTTRALEGQVELCIRDNGPGIPAELRPRVCDPFFSTKARGKGSGLGLYLVAKIARECGAELSIDDAQPSGTSITLRIPVLAEGP